MSAAELERLAAATLFPGFPGRQAPDWLLRWIERGIGGVVLFAWNVGSRPQLSALCEALRREQPELLIATDEEGGDVTRLEADRGSSYPGNLALGRVDDEDLTERVAAAIANELASVGVNLDFAPVADANTNPRNPIVGVRAFGSEPREVARHVAAFVRGLQSRHVAACAKHFPGHGDTELDSHLGLPLVHGDPRPALVPFRAAIDAGVRSIMTAHIGVTSLDSAPATLSRRILHDLLREELGFEGLVITDALEMRAISATVGVEQGAVQALAAGADALCLGHDLHADALERIHAAIVAAVREGKLPHERLDAAVARVRELGAWASAAAPLAHADGALGLAAARRAISAQGRVTVARETFVVELLPEPSIAAGETGASLAQLLGERSQAVGTARIEPQQLDADGILAAACNRQLVLVVRDAHRFPWIRGAVETLAGARPDTLVIETGLPLWRPECGGYIATYGSGRVNLEAAAELLHP
jgi:beta-N-acetylhexosaminidase